ncbi:MAG: histidinol-phosphate transaminase [Gammaproteobacteria bacterium]|nr:histidinol-phosphate transaminase [Gammaproteobacteria bacterium]
MSDTPRAVPGVLQIAPYQQGKSKIGERLPRYKLSANESAFGTPPAAVDAYESIRDLLHRYPDGNQADLREAIADVYGLEADQIVCGNGSEEIIGLTIRCFMDAGDELLLSENFFGVCALYAMSVGAKVVTAPEKHFVTDVDALLARVTDRTRVVILANPNNPTGTYVAPAEIERLHQGLPSNVVLLLDGAYAEYVTAPDYDAGAELVERSENVVMTRSFSKMFGLAGLRIGWCYAPPGIVGVLQRLRVPFNANAAAMAAAAEAVRDQAWVERVRDHNARWLARISEELTRLGVRVVPSVANFYLIVFDDCDGKSAAGAAGALEAEGIIPRPVGAGGGDGHDVLRITVGDDDANRAVLDVLQRYLTA